MNIYFYTPDTLYADTIRQTDDGDIGMLYKEDTISIWVVTQHLKSLLQDKHCIDVIFTNNITIDLPCSEPIIFEYNGLKKRKGNTSLLKQISEKIDEIHIKALLRNCLDVLEFKEDRLNIEILLNVYRLPSITIIENIPNKEYPLKEKNAQKSVVAENNSLESTGMDRKDKAPNNIPNKPQQNTAQPQDFYFYDFLEPDEQKEWTVLWEQNTPTREIYHKIKSLNKHHFGNALKEFNKQHPDCTIYSLKPFSERKSNDNQDKLNFKRLSEFKFIYNDLEEKGYVQISENEWENKEGKHFIMQIHPLD